MQHIEKSQILFVINPNAGRKSINRVLKSIRKIDSGIKYIITDSLEQLQEAMDNDFCNYKVFVAVGGDGTVNSLINYLTLHNDKALAIIPLGSGNGFAIELGFKFDVENLIEQITKGETIDIDVLQINGNSFINLAGIGLDAEIAHNFQKFGERGFISYIFSTIWTYISYKPLKASIVGNNINVDGTFQMISIANTRQFGNNAYISPSSKSYDGQFEIVMLKTIPVFLIPEFVYRLFKGNLRESAYISYLSCKDPVTIKTNSNRFHIDGDPLTSKGQYEISMNDKHLKVIKMDSIITSDLSVASNANVGL